MRINAQTTLAGASSHHIQGTPVESISDGYFINCNYRHRESGNVAEPPKL